MSSRFDELIHQSSRLSLCATLAAAEWAEFAFLRDRLSLSDSALSKHVASLEAAGYVESDRRLDGTRHRLRVRLTDVGRAAYDGHVAALREIVGAGVEAP